MADLHFDTLVIGGGQAGIPLVWALAGEGQRVALAERKHLGGTCVNYGCTPTKAALASARVAHQARRASEYGVQVDGVEVDFEAVIERARRILLQSRNGIQDEFEGTDNPKLFRGHARFTGRGRHRFQLDLDGTSVTADQVVINVGGRTLVPPIEGLDAVNFIHAGNWLEHAERPEHIAVIGGGYIGLEMGQFYRRMGSEVTLVQSGGQVAPREDEEVARALQEYLEEEGITFKLNRRATRVEPDGEGLRVHVDGEDGQEVVTGTELFVATGRRPNTDDLGLETVGVETDPRGYIEADERLKTNVDGIWVAGDVRGGPMFTHTSWDDNRVLQAQLLGDGTKTTDRVVPYAVFTDPELGRVGLTEREAREQIGDVKVSRYEMANNGKANEIGETKGFIKVVVNPETDHIVGAAVLAAEGAELVHSYVDVMNAGVPYSVIRDAVHIHPTLSEAVQSAVTALE